MVVTSPKLRLAAVISVAVVWHTDVGPKTHSAPAAWMACDFTSFSTVFQSYQDAGRVKMKGCVP